MRGASTPPKRSTLTYQRKEFRFASKEGLIIVSLILFGIYALWYKIFEYYYYDNLFRWLFIFTAFSFVVFVTMVILLITGIFVFLKDRKYIITHEKFGAPIFLIGSIILLTIPLAWTADIIDYQGATALNSFIFICIGAALCIIGSLILARTGGFFSVWLIGVSIYLIMSFHEGFQFFVWTMHFGPYDDFVGVIGIYIVATSLILFLYHDLKFFYLSHIIKHGNKLRKAKKYREAIKCFNKALRIYPLFTTAWNNMGNVYYNQGKSTEAIKCYQRALNINPEYNNAKKNLLVISERLQKG